MRYLALFAVLSTLGGCGPTQPGPVTPTPAPDSAACDDMCKHIGPKDQGGLGCPEGDPVYDSDLPGPVDVPNKTCSQFCLDQETNGVFLNPKCVTQVTSCDQIEDARRKTCP